MDTLINWDHAGPVDPLTELAQACRLNAKLHDDVVAVREGLHDAADEADLAHITADTTPDQVDPRVPWALAWRTRSAAWQLRKREVLERALA